MDSFGSRVAATVTVGVGWIVFFVLWLAFYAGNFDFWQNMAVFIASIVVAVGIVSTMWIKWVL